MLKSKKFWLILGILVILGGFVLIKSWNEDGWIKNKKENCYTKHGVPSAPPPGPVCQE